MNEELINWRLRKIISRLDEYKGNGTSMISLIIPPRDQICQVIRMLGEEHGTASNIKSRITRQAVLGAIVSVQEKLKLYGKTPKNGLVIYCGTVGVDDGKERKINIDIVPDKPVASFMYKCDNKFYTEVLQEQLVFGLLNGSRKDILHKISVELPKKHGRGGQSAARFGRLRLEKRHNYVRKVAEMTGKLFIEQDKVMVSGFIVAGSAEFKTDLIQSDMLDQRIKDKIISVYDIGYGGENGFNQAIILASDALKNVRFVRQQTLIRSFFDVIVQDAEKAVYGIEETLDALTLSAIDTLIVWEDLDISRIIMINPKSGEQHVKFASLVDLKSSSFLQDENGNMLTILEQQQLIEWLVQQTSISDAKLQIVSNKSPEGNQFCKGFGGLGGILRFKIAKVSGDDEDQNFSDYSDNVDL